MTVNPGLFSTTLCTQGKRPGYIIDKGSPRIEHSTPIPLADTPLALLAEKAHLVTDKASTVMDWPDLDAETMVSSY